MPWCFFVLVFVVTAGGGPARVAASRPGSSLAARTGNGPGWSLSKSGRSPWQRYGAWAAAVKHSPALQARNLSRVAVATGEGPSPRRQPASFCCWSVAPPAVYSPMPGVPAASDCTNLATPNDSAR
jgi:hypothetical protein